MAAKKRLVRSETSYCELLESRRLLYGLMSDGLSVATGAHSYDIGTIDVAAQANGGLIVIGSEASPAGGVLERYTSAGKLDANFGVGGRYTITSFHPSVVALQADGKIIVAGDVHNGSSSDVVIARFTTAGKPDTTFSGDGRLQLGSLSRACEVIVQKDGKIVVSASNDHTISLSNTDFRVARVTSAGAVDSSFGSSGYRDIGFGSYDYATTMAIDYNGTATSNPYYGTIVVGGYTHSGNQQSFAIARLNSNGQVDTRFSADGKTTYTFPDRQNQTPKGLVIETGGRIVVAGSLNTATTGSDTKARIGLVRFRANGDVDGTFGGSNTGQVLLTGANHVASDLTMTFGRKLLVGGSVDSKLAFYAFDENGIPDTSFAPGGKIVEPSTSAAVKFAAGPNNRRAILFGRSTSFTLQRRIDVGPTVKFSALDATAREAGKDPASFLVSRSAFLPFATRVYYTVGGSATAPNSGGVVDYSGVPIPPPIISSYTPYVDIPANANYATISITPVDDAISEPTETVTLVGSSDAAYTLGNFISTVRILDNDSAVTSKTLRATADAYVKDGTSASVNFGNDLSLQAKTALSNQRLSYLKFDLSSATTINYAKLRLFGKLNSTENSNVVVQVFGVSNQTWTETGLTWNNKPAAGTSVIGSATIIDTTARWYEFDLTAYLKAEKAAGRNIVTIMLKNRDSTNAYAGFNSDEAASERPELVIS